MARLDNRPLLGTIDRDLFVEPTIMPELRAAIERRLNILILGSRGSGKTSLLRLIAAERAEVEELPPVYVDLGPAQTAKEALAVLADALGQRWGAFGDSLRSGVIPETTSSGALLRLARRLGEAPPSLILVDGPPGGGHAHALFGRLRDELWQLGHQWVVSAEDLLRDELTRPPAAAFFDVRFDLAPLSPDEQRQFLRRRLADEPEIDFDPMVGRTDGYPRSLLQLARDSVLSHRHVDEVLAERSRKLAQLEDLPAAAATIVAYLADYGPTSGSDPRLLATLGVSGQRARQVLRDLETRDIVRSFPEQQERRGRPRKLYELREEVV